MKLILMMILCIGMLWKVEGQNNTCTKGSDPTPISYGKSTIGKYCTHYNQVDSCCTQKTIDEMFESKRKVYPSTKQCSIKPEFTDSCSLSFYSSICFETCGTIEQKATYYQGNALKVCQGLAETMFKACGAYRHCDTSKACGSTTTFADGCTTYKTFYANAKAYVEAQGMIYVEGTDTPVGTCFSAGTRVSTNILTGGLLMMIGLLVW